MTEPSGKAIDLADELFNGAERPEWVRLIAKHLEAYAAAKLKPYRDELKELVDAYIYYSGYANLGKEAYKPKEHLIAKINSLLEEKGPTPEVSADVREVAAKLSPHTTSGHNVEVLKAFTASVRKKTLEKACGIVYGQCSSDNEAQRIVDAIRGLMKE